MILKEYQKTAVKELLGSSIKELNKNKELSSIVFKAPTGSGKTIMMQHFLKDFSESELKDEYCFIWISVNDLSNQSKKSFEKNLEGSKLYFSFLEDIENSEFRNNEILFINWEKIRTINRKTGNWKVLAMKDNERDENLPTYLENTHTSGRKVILIVDESHRSLDTPKAQELIKNYIKPVLQIEVSATPDSIDYEHKIDVNIDDVIKEGMIKKEVLINESLKDLADADEQTDKIVLNLAFYKQRKLLQSYDEEGSDVKPLVLIQLPSEAKKTTDIDKTKLERIIHILKQDYNLTFENQKLAIWLSEDKTNKELIDIQGSPVEALIFKQAIATGWDCPRAQILVMFREIKTITFEIQTVGRILRMPEWKHYNNEILNKAYVYTDLPKAEMAVGETAKNLIKNQVGIRNKEFYKNFTLQSYYKSRGDYKDLGLSFYATLAEILVNTVSGKLDDFARIDNLLKLENYKGFDIKEKEIISSILSDGKILVDIDSHTGEKIVADSEIETKTQEELIKLSFDSFARNEVGPQFTNISRSYKKIIEGLYYSLDYYFFGKSKTRLYYQKLILNNKDFFLQVLKDAKDTYIPIRKKEVKYKKKKAESKGNYLWSIPTSQGFSEKAKIIDYKKNILQPSFINFDSTGEQLFIEKYLEKSDMVKFWYKNGTLSEQFFAIPYIDKYGEKRPFYPDFIVYFKDGTIGIFDPKSGFTLEDGNLKAKGLEKYIKKNVKRGKRIIGGLIEIKNIKDTNTTTILINNTWDYSLNNRSNFSIFSDEYIKNFSFEELTGISEKYKNEIKSNIQELEKSLSILEKEYKAFIKSQENSGDFDYDKRSELIRGIEKTKNDIFSKKDIFKNLI